MSLIPVISSRKGFYKAGEISRLDRIKLVNLVDPRPANNYFMSNQTFKEKIKNKHVVLLIHGYNNTFQRVCDAYLRITNQLRTNEVPFDVVVGYVWPGGSEKLYYWSAKKRAIQLSSRIGKLIREISEDAEQVDIIAHSLGCFLTLKALQTAHNSQIRNIYLMAAAVVNYKLSKGLPFANAIKKADTVFVFRSTDDDVLKISFRFGEWGDAALGYTGPKPHNKVEDNVLTINCSNLPDTIEHGSYSRRTEIFKFITNHQAPKNTPTEVELSLVNVILEIEKG